MRMSPAKVVCRVIGRAAVQPAALCAGGALAAIGTAAQSGTLLALGLAAYFLSTTLALVRRRFWRNVVEAIRREGPSLPVFVESGDPNARVLLARLVNARYARREAWEHLPVDSPVRVAAAERSAELEEMAVGLLRAWSRLDAHMAGDGRGPLRDQITWLAERAQAADPEVRAEYHRAMVALQQKLEAIGELDRKRQLLSARLQTVVCTLEALGEELAERPLIAAADGALADDALLVRVLDEMHPLEPVGAARAVSAS